MLEFLFGPSSPTRAWPPYAGQKLVFNLDEATLNGRRIGQPLESVSFLGPDEDRKGYRECELRYHSLGVCVECLPSDEIRGFHVVYRDPDAKKYDPFGGRVMWRGREIDLGEISEDRFMDAFGECYWRDDDDDETILFYEFPDLEWQVEFQKDGQLKRLIATGGIIMEDEKQRRAYGVTKPWPPEAEG